MGISGEQRCIVSKSSKRPEKTHDRSREWTTLLECISLDRRLLSGWNIFKGVTQQKKWHDTIEEIGVKYYISTSISSWTDGELGLEWLKQCFDRSEPEGRIPDAAF